MELKIKTIAGADAGTYELNDTWLEREKGEQAVHDTVVAYLANQRAGTACTKTKGNVRGGGAKPYRQKGTGNARAGSNRSPIWRGGGVIFGPVPRSYSKKVNKKVRKLALRRALAQRVDAGEVIVVEHLKVNDHKTKSLVQILKDIGANQNALLFDADVDGNLKMASGNIPKAAAVAADSVNVYQLLLHRVIVTTTAGLDKLGERLS